MKSGIRLEDLATELLREILTLLNPRDLNAFARSCRKLNNQTQPLLYFSWAYHGQTHSRKSLMLFIRTMFTNPHLAAQVKTLDIGDWQYNISAVRNYGKYLRYGKSFGNLSKTQNIGEIFLSGTIL